MMKSRLFPALAMIAGLAAAPASAQTVTLKVANFTPAQGTSVARVFVPWIQMVEKEAAGALKLDGFWGGSLGRNPEKQYDLVKNGVADIAFVVVAYNAGQFPDLTVLELPLVARSATEGSLAATRMHEKGMLRGLNDIHLIGLFANEPNSIHSTKPIKSLADLAGQKIRANGALQSLFLKQFGAVPIGMPVTEVTESLSRGVIDGAVFNIGALYAFRINGVTSYDFMAPLGVSPFLMAMNKRKWDSLPANAKAAIGKYSGETFARFGGGAFDDFGRATLNKAKADTSRTVVEPTDAELAKEQGKIEEIYRDWEKRTPGGDKNLAALKQILAEIRAGK